MIAAITNDRMTADTARPSSRAAGARFSDVFGSATAAQTRPVMAFATRHEQKVATAEDAESARLNEAVVAFKKELSMTPAERVRRDVLKSMDLTEAAIKDMPPKERVEVEQKIAMEVARRMKIMQGGSNRPTPAVPGSV